MNPANRHSIPRRSFGQLHREGAKGTAETQVTLDDSTVAASRFAALAPREVVFAPSRSVIQPTASPQRRQAKREGAKDTQETPGAFAARGDRPTADASFASSRWYLSAPVLRDAPPRRVLPYSPSSRSVVLANRVNCSRDLQQRHRKGAKNRDWTNNLRLRGHSFNSFTAKAPSEARRRKGHPGNTWRLRGSRRPSYRGRLLRVLAVVPLGPSPSRRAAASSPTLLPLLPVGRAGEPGELLKGPATASPQRRQEKRKGAKDTQETPGAFAARGDRPTADASFASSRWYLSAPVLRDAPPRRVLPYSPSSRSVVLANRVNCLWK